MVSEDRKFLILGIVALLILIVYAQTAPPRLFGNVQTPEPFKPEVKIDESTYPYQRTGDRGSGVEVNTRLDKYECFICEEKKPGFLGLFGQPSLQGGKCYFKQFTEKELNTLLEKQGSAQPQSYVVNFMLGQGPTFFAYDSANQFCESSLGFAVKWATNKKDGRPPEPASGGTAACFLKQNVFPIYVYYSEGRYVDYENMKKFVEKLKDAGPVIVTTEAEYDENQIEGVKQQIRAIIDKCPNCLIALFPKDLGPDFARNGDLSLIERVVESNDIYTHIAFVAQGTIANRYDFCQPEEAPIRMSNLSKHILKKTSLPTLYIYYGAYEGKNRNDNCDIDSDLIASNFDYIGANRPAIEASGILGIGYVTFGDYVEDPNAPKLPPTLSDKEAKAVGLVNKDGDQKNPYFNKWFNNCKSYYENTRKGQNEQITGEEVFNTVPLCYSSAGSNAGLQFVSVLNSYSVYKNYGDNDKPEDNQDLQPSKLQWSCAECLGDPGPFVDGVKPPIKEATNNKEKLCNGYANEISSSASKCDLDPMFIRALIWQESAFDPCAVSATGVGAINPTTYNPSCSSSPYNGLHSDACAMGLMQCTDAPTDYSGPTDGRCPIQPSQRSISCQVNGKYNPFEPGQSVCCGTNYLCTLKSTYEKFVEDHESELDFGIQTDPQRRNWMIYWLMSVAYQAGPGNFDAAYDRWLGQKDASGVPTTCSGNKDIADYICNCADVSFLGDQAYACKIAAKYKALNTVCDNTCSQPLSPGIGPIGNTGVCVVDYAIGQIGCPYLYGGSGGDTGNACTGTTYNRYGDNDACDVSITGHSGVGEGRVSSIADAPEISRTACVTGLCPDNRRSYFDCSGLVYAAFNACHPEVGIARTAPYQCDGATGEGDARYTHEQYPGGRGLENVLVAGDIIEVSGAGEPGTCSIDGGCNCISQHVGIYAGNGRVISAPATCGKVRVDTLERFLQDHQPFTEACHYKATETAVVIGSS